MTTEQPQPSGPDLAAGIAETDVTDGGMLLGHVGEEKVLLARVGHDLFAIGATCTHYGGPLAEGLLVGETVRCPWHHACFSLRTGRPVRAPALHPLGCWKVERTDGRIVVREKQRAPKPATPSGTPRRILIVGGGAAGTAAAKMLRQEGF